MIDDPLVKAVGFQSEGLGGKLQNHQAAVVGQSLQPYLF